MSTLAMFSMAITIKDTWLFQQKVSIKDEEVLERFNNTTTRNDEGRYCVHLTLKEETSVHELGSNFRNAKFRLDKVVKKLQAANLCQAYDYHRGTERKPNNRKRP